MNRQKIVIINYGMGNLGSIANMLNYLEYDSSISSEPEEILNADKLILPGVGAFDSGMKNLALSGLVEAMNHSVLEKKTPILGICLGMQLMTKRSDEGVLPGLGWFGAETMRFDFSAMDKKLKIPHMGWNFVNLENRCELTEDLPEAPKYYFVHSYYVKPENNADVMMTSHYGLDFCSAVHKDNIYGVQFHPEKSHKYGMALLKNFCRMTNA